MSKNECRDVGVLRLLCKCSGYRVINFTRRPITKYLTRFLKKAVIKEGEQEKFFLSCLMIARYAPGLI